jgi:hypothetical protein
MNLDIRNNRDYSKALTFKSLWLKEQYSRLRKIYDPSQLSNEEIKDILLKKYNERRLVVGRLYSNTTQKNEAMNQEQFIDLYLNKPYILSGYAALYEDHGSSINIGSSALKFLLDSRKNFKKKMEESEYGSDQYIYYKILQSTFKVLANSYYGIIGERNSVFYNPHVQNSISMTGQDLITVAIVALENFLADNTKFNDFDDLLYFIDNTLGEEQIDSILNYVDSPIGYEELYNYLINKLSNPASELVSIRLKETLKDFSLEQINRLYYKNKILEFIFSSTYLKNQFQQMLKYEYKEVPEEAMKPILNEFRRLILNFCFSNIIFEDRFKRSMKDDRKNVILSDTDSAFVNLNNYLEKVSHEFKLGKTSNIQQMTIINIFVNIVTEMLEKTFYKVTGNMGITDKFKNLISMKNEFLFKKILLTRNKKSYSGLITGELGKTLNRPVLEIKGISIRKSSVAKQLRKEFTDILTEDILSAESVDLKKIIRKFDELGIQVENSLKSGELTYALPRNVEQIDGYKEPTRLEPVRGTIIWNALETERQITPPEKVNVVKLKAINKDGAEMQQLKNSYPDKYAVVMKTVFNEGVESPKIDISRFGLNVISIPKSIEKIPDYLLPLIDLSSMVSDNMTNGYIILESLGIYTEEVKTTKYKSNIVEI